jgi:hypothetical protein
VSGTAKRMYHPGAQHSLIPHERLPKEGFRRLLVAAVTAGLPFLAAPNGRRLRDPRPRSQGMVWTLTTSKGSPSCSDGSTAKAPRGLTARGLRSAVNSNSSLSS